MKTDETDQNLRKTDPAKSLLSRPWQEQFWFSKTAAHPSFLVDANKKSSDGTGVETSTIQDLVS